jgi:hypothetical protein
MVGDWIKMRTDLYRDPKVCVIADLLLDSDSDMARYVNQNYQRNMTVTRNVMRNAVVGALLSVWGVMRHRGKRNGDDLNCHGVSVSVIDDIADMRGFGEAMAHVCWVVEDDNCIVFPRFFADYNAEPGVQGKSKNAERQRRFREKKKAESNDVGNVTNNVTRDVTVTHREEKRREEKKKEKDIGSAFALPMWVDQQLWDDFIEMRKKIKKPATDRAKQLLVNELQKLVEQGYGQEEIIGNSIKNCWQDFYAPKHNGNSRGFVC